MTTLRLALAQLNPTVGDFAGNQKKIIAWIRDAEKQGADVIVFPEIAVSGYPVWDLANKESFIKAGLESLKEITRATQGLKISAVIGYIHPSRSSKSHNALAWIQNGKRVTTYSKQLLPTYDVFLEGIFFEPGTESTTVTLKGIKIGLTICEDIWDETYTSKPLRELAKQKADLVLNLSASPFFSGVSSVREQLIVKHCRKYKFPMLYVNQVGGQDDLIFDGRSFFCDEKGRILFKAPAFEEGLYFFDWKSGKTKPEKIDEAEPVAEMYKALVLGIRDYCRKNGFSKTVLGLSGGIDSALVAALAVDALGPHAVLGITMPSEFSSTGSWNDSMELAENLGIRCLKRPIKNNYRSFLEQQKNYNPDFDAEKINLAKENLQARLRGLELMYVSNDEGRLVLTTGNKSELAMGYCTLYGDMAGGLAVLGDVLKTDVYRLARYRNQQKHVIPKAILEKAPSAELRPNQKDQDSLPPYDLLDAILKAYIESNQSPQEILRGLRIQYPKADLRSLIAKVMKQVDHNEYKRRQTPPILRVTQKAWFGRRMPITNRFDPIF